MRGGRGKPGSMTQAKWVRLTRLRNAQDYPDLSRPLDQCYTASAVSGMKTGHDKALCT